MAGVYYDFGRLTRVLIDFEPVETAAFVRQMQEMDDLEKKMEYWLSQQDQIEEEDENYTDFDSYLILDDMHEDVQNINLLAEYYNS